MIAVAFALKFESAAFRASHPPRRLCVWNLGITGPQAAPALLHRIQICRPSLIVSAGFATALQEHLALGDLVVGMNYSDSRLLRSLRVPPDFHMGLLHTAGGILATAKKKRSVGIETNALAGDMESEHLAGICKSAGIPMLALRCISDAADQNMPVPPAVLLDPVTARPNPLALLRHVCGHPGCAAGLARLIRGSLLAQRNLAEGLATLLPQLLRMPA